MRHQVEHNHLSADRRSWVVPEMCVDRNLRYFPTAALCPAKRDFLQNPQAAAGYTLRGEGWSALRRLANLFFRNSANPARCVMGTFDAYFDMSGGDRWTGAGSPQFGAPILVVAGYLAHVDEWLSFEKDWNLLLDGKGLRSFDMAQFENRKDPYATWAETEREEFIQSLLSTIKRWAGVLIAWGIEIDDWPNEGQIAKAYTLCALAIPGHGRSLCVLFPSSFCLLRPATKSPEEPQFKAVGAVFLKKDPCRGSGRGDGVSRLVRMQTPEDVVLNLHAFHAAKEYRGVKVVRTDHGAAHFGQTRAHIAIHGINEANFLEFEYRSEE